jgi:hypothetical protein
MLNADEMIANCTNSACRKRFTSFAEGRVFQFEIVSISVAANDAEVSEAERDTETPRRELASFWLCGDCAATLTLTLEPAQGLQLVPVETTIMPAKDRLHSSRKRADC